MPTFLLADDSDDKLMLMQVMLKRAGWEGETVIAMTTEQAEKLIDTHTIDFAFVDYYIPSHNGPAIISYLKGKNPDARIALVSSADNRSNFNQAKEAGAEACICTSYPSDEVEKAFDDVLSDWLA